ncbi:MAG: T9SS type A sorting domain-containing protein [Saprospiraceae bacterium]
MKKFYPNFYAMLLFLFCLCGSNDIVAQVSMTFENLTTSQNCNSTACNYTDPTPASSAHPLADVGGIPVSSPSSGAILGFSSSFQPTRTGSSSTGLNDGDFFGYATSVTINSNVGQNAVEGAQAFIAEDTDGEVSIIFDQVDLTGAVTPMFSMNYILDGTFENSDGADDSFSIDLVVTGCGAATTISLLNVTPSNRNTFTSQTWFPLSQNLTPYIGCQVQLIVKIDLNSSTEEVAIDNIVFSAGVALPVELISFTANPRKENIDLNWSTASEINNDKFEIEESQDGRDFQKIGEIKGNGTITNQQEYSFQVENPQNGISYFRLKQIDYDGRFEYSKVVSVNFKSNHDEVEVFYPNPSKSGMVSLNYASNQDNEIIVSVFDMSGKLITTRIKEVLTGSNNLSFDFSELNQGIYIVTFKDEKNPSHRKLIIQR